MIAFKAVSKRMGDVLALSEVSFELADGDCLTVIGPSGSGKTTLLRLIAGLELPDQGEIWLDGKIVSRPGWGVLPHLRGIAMAFQFPALWPHLTVAQNILFGLGKSPAPEKRQRLAELLSLVELTGLERRFPYQLSGGEARRVGIARALAPRPRYLLLDEPLAHQDPVLQSTLLSVIQSARSSALNLVYVTHAPGEVQALGGKVLRLSRGNTRQPEVSGVSS